MSNSQIFPTSHLGNRSPFGWQRGRRLVLMFLLACFGILFWANAGAQQSQLMVTYQPLLFYSAYQPNNPNGSYLDVCPPDAAYAQCKAVTISTWIGHCFASGNINCQTSAQLDTYSPYTVVWGYDSNFSFDLTYSYNNVPPYTQTPGNGTDGYGLHGVCSGGDAGNGGTASAPLCIHYFPLPAPPCNCGHQTTTPPSHTINVQNGREVHRELDFVDPKGTLTFERVYSSQTGEFLPEFFAGIAPDYSGTPSSVFAACITVQSPAGTWLTGTVPTCLPFIPTTGGGLGIIDPDVEGRIELYPVTGTTVGKNSPDQTEAVTIIGSGTSTTFAIHRPLQGVTDTYDYNGYHIKRAWPDGRYVTYTYNTSAPLPNAFAGMTDNFGRQLTIAVDQASRPTGFTGPDGRTTTITYEPATCNCQFTDLPMSVSYPDGTSKQYFYHEASLDSSTVISNLTGVVDENNSRFLNVTYNSNGLATESDHAGFDQYQVSPGASMTNPLGGTLTYGFTTNFNTIVASSTTQPAGAGYSSATSNDTYDANGNPKTHVDFNGNQTNYTYDLTRNLETVRTEAYGQPEARTISTKYHPYWELASGLAEPKKITTWVYNGQPDPSNGNAIASCAPSSALVDGQAIAVVCKMIEQATTDLTGASAFAATSSGAARVSKFTYDVNGQLLTATDPLGNVTTNVYYTSASAGNYSIGDLNTTKDAKGHVTTFTKYDGAGRLLSMTDPNGVITTLTYKPRGWLATKVVTEPSGAVETSTYSYDNVGQLTEVLLPDSTYIKYAYDAAHRLQTVTDSAGDTVNYTLDNMGNRTAEAVKDPSGTLTRNIARTFDTLGRLASVTGAAQ